MPSRSLLRSTVAVLLLLLGGASHAASQEGAASSNTNAGLGQPTHAVTVGLGNTLGWLGAGVERFFMDGRVSGAIGAGYLWEREGENPSTAAFGAAVRRYLGAGKHQAVVELSATLVSMEWTRVDGVLSDFDRYYGPGALVGYRYTADGGFHFTGGLGAGWAVGDDSVAGIGILAVGHTWRR